MDAILSWPPLIWLGRMFGLLVLGSASVVALALLVRVLQPSNLRALAYGNLPAIRKGRFTVMGQAFDVSTAAESDLEDEVAQLKRRMDAKDDRVDKLARIVLSLEERLERRDV